MSSIIETIKAKVDVVDEIGLVVALQKAGKSLKGLCPLHNERTPSFYVFPETQTWRCFGCNEGGDVFSFVQKQQSLDFHETLLYLAEKAGINVEDVYSRAGRDPEEAREASAARERLRKLNEDALLWFHQILLRSKEAAEARAYVQSRGISTESTLAFALGYAPERWDGLTRYLLSQGYTPRELVVGGLAREREFGGSVETGEERAGESGIYDYFRQRIIFPIRDVRGRVIGFGGRALGEHKPKYLNSPQTLLFEKNSVLYAIDRARDAIKQAKQVVIVEGYVDALIAHQYGTQQTVACIGSAITEKHIQQLKKLTRQVTLALDPDAAGSAATEHGIQEALKGFDRTIVPIPIVTGKSESKQQLHGIIRLEEQVDAEINIMKLPEGEDPDELIRRDYAGWLYAVSHPVSLVDYYFDMKTVGLNVREPRGKTEAARRLLPIIATISDRIKRDAYIRKLSAMINADERLLYEELQRVLRGQRQEAGIASFSDNSVRAVGQREQQSRQEPAWDNDEKEKSEQKGVEVRLDRKKENAVQWEDYLIGLLLRNPELNLSVCGIITDSDFTGTDTRELYHILNSSSQRGSSPSHQPIEQYLPPALLDAVARARQCVESRLPDDRISLVKEAMQCAARLKRMQLLQQNIELKYLIGEAFVAGDSGAVKQLQPRLMEIHQRLRTLNSAMPLQG